MTRADILTLTPPADLAPGLIDALDHIPGHDARVLATDLARGGAVSAPGDLLDETVRVAIDEAGERVGQESTRLVRREGQVSDLRARLRELSALLDLLERLER